MRPDGTPDFSIIVGAPDLTELIKHRTTTKARHYRDRTAGVFKLGVIASIQNGNFPDAATLLWHGPGAATAIGDLADNYNSIAVIVDNITSPSSPIATTILTVLPMLSQLARNHEKQLQEIPSRMNMSREAREARKAAKSAKAATAEPPVTVKVGRWRIPIRWKFRPSRLGKFFATGVMSQTQEPNLMAANVFTNPKVIRELSKMGINIVQPSAGNNDGR